ncbi:metallophosphoesterase [Bremerella sp. JC770]|uniref:metallophosphoesterase n=1 Tax=Bremerella sp. JC770 TaxID=3232137 RepID=UPI00345786F7
MYDIIGDIHGHADALAALLGELGYKQRDGVYTHPDRRVVFLGDFVDRGPKIRETLDLVRGMVETDAAVTVMGNHELNAMAFHTPHPDQEGAYLRPHTAKNEKQHSQTLLQLSDSQLSDALAWFRTLPMWLELEGLRAVHACWDGESMDAIANQLERSGGLTDEVLASACLADGALFPAVEVILKGREMQLPEGVSFKDKDGHERTKTRTRWFLDAYGHTFGSYAMTDQVACDLPLPSEIHAAARPYGETEKPVFLGHYWLKDATPRRLARNVACVDYSVAKGGFLCAYRWDGEQELSDDKFIFVS